MADVTPEPIFQVASGFMAAKHVFVANEVGLFEQLANGPATLDELAERTGISRRRLRILADAMVVLGFVERHGDSYQNAPIAATFLTGHTSADLRPFLRFWNRLSYPNWTKLEDAIRTGQAQSTLDLPEEAQRIFFPKGWRPSKRPRHKPSPPPMTLVATSVFWTLVGVPVRG